MVCCICVTVGLLGVIAALGYIFLTWTFDHWKKRGVRGPQPNILYGTCPGVIDQKRSIANDLSEIYEQYKNDEDYVGIYQMRTPQLLVLSPDLARKVYVTNFRNFHDNETSQLVDEKNDIILSNNPFMLRGEAWKTRRQEITPALTINRIKVVYPVTQEVCKRLIQYIEKFSSRPGVDGKDLSLRFTSEVVSDCVLGIKAQSLSENPTPILGVTKTLFVIRPTLMIYMVLVNLFPQIKNFFKMHLFRKSTEDFFLGLMKSAFDLRRKENIDRPDFLNYMLQLQEKKDLSNEQLASHTMTFLIDGFETSASVLAHCLYQLAKSPTAQEILLQEIKSNTNEAGEIEFEKLHELPYLDQCINESIRLIPPLLFSSKLCTEPCELTNKNGSKLQLRVNDVITIPVHAMHHDKDIYKNPEAFIPERFSPENGGVKKFRDMGAFYPFGDGPRICLGMRFALTQVKAALAEIIRNFDVKLNPKTRMDNKLNGKAFIGELDGGVWLDFEKRKWA